MAAAQPRLYRRILTSALHRRFVHASATSLLVCYAIAFAIGDKTSCMHPPSARGRSWSNIIVVFWSWFPISACGVRTVLLFVSSLSVFVLRVSQMHMGARHTNSSLSTFRHLFPVQVFQTFGWYIFSAWWFTEVYLWSSAAEAHLEMVKRARCVTCRKFTPKSALTNSKQISRACLPKRATHLYPYFSFHFGMRASRFTSLLGLR